MLMCGLLMKENWPLEAPDAFVKPFTEGEQATAGEQDTGGS